MCQLDTFVKYELVTKNIIERSMVVPYSNFKNPLMRILVRPIHGVARAVSLGIRMRKLLFPPISLLYSTSILKGHNSFFVLKPLLAQ